jgi:hypothetical protein
MDQWIWILSTTDPDRHSGRIYSEMDLFGSLFPSVATVVHSVGQILREHAQALRHGIQSIAHVFPRELTRQSSVERWPSRLS